MDDDIKTVIIIENPPVQRDSVRMITGELTFMSGDVDAAFKCARSAVDYELAYREHGHPLAGILQERYEDETKWRIGGVTSTSIKENV